MGALFIPRPVRGSIKTHLLPQIIRPRVAMASPPTVTFGTATAFASAASYRTFWASTNDASYKVPSTPTRSHFSYSRTIAGQGSDGLASVGTNGVSGSVVTSGTTTTRTPGMFQASFMHYGRYCEIVVAQTSTAIMVRVNDEYISLTPQALGSGGTTTNYYHIDFGSVDNRRIDVIGAASFTFRGVNVAPGDMVFPAPIRGPRTILLGDSFSQPALQGWGAYFADAMRWDDVWSAGVGGTGWNRDATGASQKFGDRIASDVIAYAPDIVMLYGSLNDNSQSAATCGANAAAGTAAIRAALPECLIVGGYNAVGGIETMSANALDVMDAVKAGILSAGGIWLNPVEMPFEYNGATPSTTLGSNHAAGRLGSNPNAAPYSVGTAATGLYCASAVGNNNLRVGSTVEFGTGATRERVVILNRTQINGSNSSYSFQGALQYAHSSGETVREVGASYMTGSGEVGATTGWGNADTLVSADAVHPSVTGHQVLGLVQAQLLRDWLARMTAAERAKYSAFVD